MENVNKMITAQQLKAARALLGINQHELALIVGLSRSSVRRLESKPGPLHCSYETATAIMVALAGKGIRFQNTSTNDVGLTHSMSGLRHPEGSNKEVNDD